MLFKNKGMKPDLGNWQGIMLLDAASKIVCAIIAGRLTRLLEAERMEEQKGFMPRRSTTDGIFSLKILLQKHKEHGLSMWVVFIDLAKAFDSVSRDGLYKMLQKMGVPMSLRTLIIALHTDFMVKNQVRPRGRRNLLHHRSETRRLSGTHPLSTIFPNVYRGLRQQVDCSEAKFSVQDGWRHEREEDQ